MLEFAGFHAVLCRTLLTQMPGFAAVLQLVYWVGTPGHHSALPIANSSPVIPGILMSL